MMIPLQPEWVLAHPHDNMEIITIPLEGDLAHKDSMGNTEIIRNGDVQVMSAGTGVKHTGIQSNKDQRTKLLQIWVFQPKNVEPRYQQITLDPEERINCNKFFHQMQKMPEFGFIKTPGFIWVNLKE
jgi:redox-sensitive bicupin YhaK (pirin superfamily)